MKSAETSNFTTEVLSRHCIKILKKSMERKPTHPQDFLSQKILTSFWKKKYPQQMGRNIIELSEDHLKDYNVMKNNFADPLIVKDEIWAAVRKIKLGKSRDEAGYQWDF